MAAYLATVTIGKFKVEQYTTRSGIKVYDAVDPRLAKDAAPTLKRLPSVLEWGSKLFGPYPFRASGSIVDHAPDVGYALETQTRPVYSSAPDLSTLVHESAHQWFGDSVSLTSWKDIWLNEGFASYAEWLHAEQHGGFRAQQTFDDLYTSAPPVIPCGRSRPTNPAAAHRHRRPCLLPPPARLGGTAPPRTRHHRPVPAAGGAAVRKDLGPLFHEWLYAQGKPSTP